MAQTVVPPRVAIIGAGWAGLACAVGLASRGIRVTVYESNLTPGGRARRVLFSDGKVFDNGQHLLLGAYTECLRLIALVNPRPLSALLHRMPLTLAHTRAPSEPPDIWLAKPRVPLGSSLIMLAAARGLSLRDRVQLATYLARLTLFTIRDATRTVEQDMQPLPEIVRRRVLGPLCLAALNTPPSRASAIVFQNVLRATLVGGTRASDMLLPKVDLTALFPEPAAEWVQCRGATVRLGEAVRSIGVTPDQRAIVVTRQGSETFEHAVVAVAPHAAARLLFMVPTAQATARALCDVAYEPITTFYAPLSAPAPGGPSLLRLCGVDDPGIHWIVRHPERGSQCVVVSGQESNADEFKQQGLSHVASALGCRPEQITRISERRATYSCTPQLHARFATLPKPPPPLWITGDYCYPRFPATLESAVRAGTQCANDIIRRLAH